MVNCRSPKFKKGVTASVICHCYIHLFADLIEAFDKSILDRGKSREAVKKNGRPFKEICLPRLFCRPDKDLLPRHILFSEPVLEFSVYHPHIGKLHRKCRLPAADLFDHSVNIKKAISVLHKFRNNGFYAADIALSVHIISKHLQKVFFFGSNEPDQQILCRIIKDTCPVSSRTFKYPVRQPVEA